MRDVFRVLPGFSIVGCPLPTSHRHESAVSTTAETELGVSVANGAVSPVGYVVMRTLLPLDACAGCAEFRLHLLRQRCALLHLDRAQSEQLHLRLLLDIGTVLEPLPALALG